VGFFKGMKDMKDMTRDAPGLTAQSTEQAANAQAAAAAKQAAAVQAYAGMNFPTRPDTDPVVGDLSPIAGVGLETYVTISRSFVEVGYDQSRGPELAARQGVGAAEWAEALDGWNARISSFPAVARRFNALYTAR
jgi:hypothetical protein